MSTAATENKLKMEAELERLREENAKLKNTTKELKLKIGDKGGLSVSGFSQRFPITLYKNDWKFLLREENIAKIVKFIDENDENLKSR